MRAQKFQVGRSPGLEPSFHSEKVIGLQETLVFGRNLGEFVFMEGNVTEDSHNDLAMCHLSRNVRASRCEWGG